MKLKKYSLVILSILILLIFVSSASAAETNKTDILSIDESANPENNLLSIDNNIESNELDNNTLKASNDEILTAENNYWYVNGSKTSSGDGSEANPFNTLNNALTNSGLQDGDTIMIASGEYKGTDNTGLTIGKNLNFIKYGANDAIFDAEQSGRIWTVTATSINITGLTFKNGEEYDGGAIYFKNTISNSNINAIYINNKAQNEGGANYFESRVSNLNVGGKYINNNAEWGGANFFNWDVSGLTVGGTYINNNAGMKGGANYFASTVSDLTVNGIYINNTAPDATIFLLDAPKLGLDVKISNAIFLNNCTNEIFATNTGVVVKDCWFGNNASNYKNNPNINDKVQINNWLFLNATVSDSSLLVMDSSNIIFKLYSTDGENVSDFDDYKFPVVNLILTATKGDVDQTTTLDNIVKYTATEKGKGSVTAKIENTPYTVYFDNIPINVNLSASAQNITYLENETLTLTYNNTATGKINITLKSKNYNKTIERDINQIITITDLPAGDYDVTVEYFGDNVFLNATAYANFTVNKMHTEILVNSSTLCVKVNNETDIGAILEPANAGNLTYKSSDENIVKVENGKVKGLKEDNATITVSFAGDDNYLAAENKTINVTVRLNDASVNVNNNTLDLLVDNTFNLIATTEPKDLTVNYTSSNPSIVTVDNKGKVRAISEGNTTITVTVGGDGTYAENSTTVNVTVSKVPTEISVNPDSLNLLVGNETVIAATLTPHKAGNVTFKTSDKNIVTVDNQGNIIAVGEGNATITVSFKGDNKYAAAENKTINVTVRLNDASVSVNNNTLNLLVDDTFNLIATTEPKTFEVNYTSSNPTVVTVDGKGNVVAVSEGNTTITVSFRSDGVYAENSTTVNVTVSKVPTEISISLDLLVGNKINIAATLTPTDAGNLTFTTSDKNIVTVDNQGNLIAVGEGNATITVRFAGNNKYHTENKTIKVNVQKVNTTMDASAGEITEGENATISVTLPSDATGNVTAKINGKTYTSQVKNGKATITIPDLSEGYYNVTVTYSGDYMYNNASTTVIIVVNPAPEPEKKNLTIQASAEPITAGQDAKVIVTNLEDATGDITVTVNGKTYTAPIKDSKATITIPGLTENETAYVNYAGDKNYNPALTTVYIVVYPKNATISINAPDVTKYYTGPERFVANVTDSKGIPLSNKNVTIVINGRSYNKVTDENGTVSLGLNLNSGIYNVTVTVDNQTVNSVVTVLPTVNATDVVKMYKNGTQYYATFLDSKGKYLADGTTVKFNINGAFYERKISGDKGLAKLNINLPPGEYVITATNPSTGEHTANNITVLATLVENKDITKYYKNATQYTVKVLGANGNPVGAGKTVTFNINGVMYQRQTNESGIAQMNINLPPGNYTITASYEGYNVANTITVLPVLSASDLQMKYMDGSQFKAKLVDGKGNPYPNKNVTFNINGVFYNRATGDDGVAKLNIRLPAGEYIITSSYNGANIANKITITP